MPANEFTHLILVKPILCEGRHDICSTIASAAVKHSKVISVGTRVEVDNEGPKSTQVSSFKN